MLKTILADSMPTAITVNGVLFELNTDYRTWLKVGVLMDKLNVAENANAVFFEICELAIRKYPENGYVIGDELLAGLLEFYKGFPSVDNEKNEKSKENSKKKEAAFDFQYDAEYIYCSFASFYGIRLQTVKQMHWWEFLTLFRGLMMSDQTSVNFVVGTRQQKITPKMPKEEKARLQKLKLQFALPKDENTRQAEKNMANMLMGKKE
jgi:hypothetical protein